MPKKEKIQEMFDGIAPSYDKLNHVMSLNVDKLWRKHALREIVDGSPQQILTKETLSESFGVSAQISETVADGETIRQITLLHTIRQEDDPSC